MKESARRNVTGERQPSGFGPAAVFRYTLARKLGTGIAVMQVNRAWDHGVKTRKKLLNKETEDQTLATFAKTKATALGFYWGNLAGSVVPPIAPVASLAGLAVGYGFEPKAKKKTIRETVKEGCYQKADSTLRRLNATGNPGGCFLHA